MTRSETESGRGGTLARYVRVLVNEKRMIMTITVVAAVCAVAVSFMIPKRYSATVMLMPAQQDQGMMGAIMGQLGGLSALAGDISGTSSRSEVFYGILSSNEIKDGIIDRFGLMKLYDANSREDAYRRLKSQYTVELDRKSGIISITVEDAEPRRAAEIANMFAAELDRKTISMDSSGASQNRKFLTEQLARSKAALSRSEEELTRFRTANQVADVAEQTKTTIEGVAQLRAQLAAQEVQLAIYRKSLTSSTPEVRNTEASIAKLKGQIARLEGTSGVGAVPALGRVPALGEQYVRLMREFKTQESLVELLTKQYELALVSETNSTTNVQVIQKARVPEKKSWPKRGELVLITTYTAFVLSILLAFVRARLAAMAEPDKAAWQQLKRDLLAR